MQLTGKYCFVFYIVIVTIIQLFEQITKTVLQQYEQYFSLIYKKKNKTIVPT